ncbi:trans-1,2-dihydrobenzene-1,2-diol dehydrogenase [Drosophila grimshawi]|uniref:trans-1,2-dihydrobenzene-1,2-diol dehydrogenase n=1 Tax=Drosophila grimshawi TaxID=7222 RepID=UPI000C86EE84|nr:trans-1,2-dihydrobenzene-1,2-diol dehydrogenase [Drosophila grimshawi]
MAEDFATALSVLPPEQHCITSCMANYQSQACNFADKYRVPSVFTSYAELARSPSVDAVYI